ncbi:MAG: carboxypeptidase-like regulatory domain-containing protein, partial [Bacteroidota bacterium]
MKRIHLIAALMALLTATPLLAQKGTLKGNVTGSADGVVESIPFASVAVVELVTGAATDFDGNYSFEVTAGTYTIVVSSIGLLPDTQRVTIVAGQTVTHSVELQKDVKVFETFEVVAKANQEAEAVQLLERKKAASIVSNIGVQKLQQTGSSNVADGLKKVAGLSVVGSKFVFVRGMGDRYNSAYLNGLPVPSLNPDKKVIRLDIFPTAITSSLNVSKSFTPELFGDFSGGAIDIRTKQYPDEPTFKVSVGGGFNSQVTFDDFQTYNGGSTDYFGFDDGTRDLPDEVVVEGDRLYNSTNDENYRFEQNFNSRTTTAPINTNWSLLGGNYYEGKKADRGFGFLVTASHRQNFNYREEVYRQVNVQEDFQLDYARESWEKSTNSSVLANLHYDFDKNHHINYNFLLANRSVDNIRESRGTHFDYDDNTILARRTTYREFRVMVHQ